VGRTHRGQKRGDRMELGDLVGEILDLLEDLLSGD
jgi:hypothetical protein